MFGGEWGKFGGALGWFTDKLIVAANHWSRGTLLWNLALDPAQPAQGRCRIRGVVTIDSATGAIPLLNIMSWAMPAASCSAAYRIGVSSGRGHRGSCLRQSDVNASRSFIEIAVRVRDRCNRKSATYCLRQWLGRHCGGAREPRHEQCRRQAAAAAFAAVASLFLPGSSRPTMTLLLSPSGAFSLPTEALLTQIVFFLAYGLLSLPAAY
jgi:hypothetical protein